MRTAFWLIKPRCTSPRLLHIRMMAEEAELALRDASLNKDRSLPAYEIYVGRC
jgi:hypothetical protein